MVLTLRHIQLIQQAFYELVPEDPDLEIFFGDIFYRRLFALYPQLEPLFHIGIAEQAHRLVTMLRFMVDHLEDPATFQMEVAALGARHVKYGVLPEHYEQVGEVLVWVLQETLGEDFTPELASAWTDTFAVIADTMRRAP